MTAARASALAPLPLRVRAIRQENAESATIELDPSALPYGLLGASPGQFNMLYVFGVGESAISVTGDCDEPRSILHTFRAVGPVTAAMRRLEPGQTLGLRGPFGTGWPMRAAEGADLVLIAGGIGLAPLRPVVHAVLARRQLYGRVLLLYGARSPDDIIFRPELEQWNGPVEVVVSVDYAHPGWDGHVGFVTGLIPRARFDPAETVGMICGPEVMMRFAANGLLERGVPEDRIFLSMERNMKCATGQCGHCQFGPTFVCRDGPVFAYDRISRLLTIREI
ncbi:NAD(P)H-flavin reductase [Constrictibacter sp. MBR-5]|jgi:NAD(P)H-flavin reductase|uniref:FAD/NAD(P)-binding protein n=1 Tax=Constrictibacter sp. MBR-5 TaxID=3156467 RepID=UPI0033978F4A